MNSALMRRLLDADTPLNPLDTEIARLLVSPAGCSAGDLGPIAHLRTRRAPACTPFLAAYRLLLSWGWMLDHHPEDDSRYVLVFDPVRSRPEHAWQRWCFETIHTAASHRASFADIAALPEDQLQLAVRVARHSRTLGEYWSSEGDLLDAVTRTRTDVAHAMLHLDSPVRVLTSSEAVDDATAFVLVSLAPNWTGTLAGLLECTQALLLDQAA